MDAVSMVTGYGSVTGPVSSPASGSQTASNGAVATAGTGSVANTVMMTSLQQSSETLLFAGQSTAAPINNELLGAILLMLLLKYLQSADTNEQQGLLALMNSLVQGQQGGKADSSVMLYSSSSLSIDTLMVQTQGVDAAANAYASTAASSDQGGSINLMA